MGVSMMIMGEHSQTIHDRSIDPYIETITREELQKQHLRKAERLQEFYSLGFATLVFAVAPSKMGF